MSDFQANRANDEGRRESIAETLWWRKQLVLLIFGLCVVSAAVLLKITPKRQWSFARVSVTRPIPKNADPVAADVGRFLNTQCELIRSANVLNLALGGPEMDDLVATVCGPSDNPTRLLADRLDVTPQANADVITVRLMSTSPKEAEQVVDAVVDSYKAHVGEQRRNTDAISDYDKIRIARDKLDAERTDANKLLLALKAETAAYLTPEDLKGNLAFQKLRTLSEAATAAQLENAKLQAEFEEALKVVGMKPDAVNQEKLESATVVSVEGLVILKDNLAKMSQQLIEAKRQYVPSHPAVRAVQAQIKEMQLSRAATLQVVSQAAAKADANSRKLVAEQETITRNIDKKAAELASLTDRVKSLDSQIALNDGKLQQLTVTESVGITVTKLDEARTDYERAEPNSKKTLGFAALIGLALGMLVAVVREWISPALGSAKRISDTVGVPLLGTLPRVSGHSQTQLAQISYEAADTEAAEAYRSVRTSLLFGAEHCQTIAITSPATGDGKSTLSCNLAILLAQSGKRVCLIDADFRQPALHEIFGLMNATGLSGVLGGEDLESATQRTPVEHLDVLTCGPTSSEVSQQLNSPRFTDVLRQLKGRYDHVLFDTAGVVGSNDARVIAAGCDTTLLVVRDERTTRFAATTARDALLSVGAMLMGIVLNDATRNGPAYPNSIGGGGREKTSSLTSAPGSRARARR